VTFTWNSDDLRVNLTQAFRAAQAVRAVLEQAPPIDAQESPEQAIETRREIWLECHARDFVIDHILSALNWRLQPSIEAGEYIQANLVTEQRSDGTGCDVRQLKPETGDNRRRLDYFGYERETDRPLLVVEAKRPRLLLPGEPNPNLRPDAHPVSGILAEFLQNARSDTNGESQLTAEWESAVVQLRDYCRIVAARAAWPARAVLTNGEWLIAFVEPGNAFAEASPESIRKHSILVFESRDHLILNCRLLWEQLAYSVLASLDRTVLPTEIPFVIDPARIESCSHGLRLSYTYKQTNFRKAPLMSVSPLLFVRSEGTTFIKVGTTWEDELPADGREPIDEHLCRVEARARVLKEDVERVLRCPSIPLVSVKAHCRDAEAFRNRPIVQSLPFDVGEVFLLLTGEVPHFVRIGTGFDDCTFHTHAAAKAQTVAHEETAILDSRLSPRSYFIDRSPNHCTHQAVHAMKRQPVTDDNRDRCGPRSSGPGGAFCEVWRFEQLLCCRTCTFLDVCSLARAFSLPCNNLVPLTAQRVPVPVPHV